MIVGLVEQARSLTESVTAAAERGDTAALEDELTKWDTVIETLRHVGCGKLSFWLRLEHNYSLLVAKSSEPSDLAIEYARRIHSLEVHAAEQVDKILRAI